MFIEIVNVAASTVPTQNGSYQKLEVAYKTADGKVQGKPLVSYKYPEVFALLSKANRGDKFDVKAVKDGKFWNWEAAVPTSGEAPTSSQITRSAGSGSVGGRVTGSNYETPEEREWNRTRIIRQSGINAAIALLDVRGEKKTDAREVIEIAKIFETFVNHKDVKQEAIKAIQELNDDIPF